jgi:hypothetical protein
MKLSPYFQNSVLSRRAYVRLEWIALVLENPERVEVQEDGRIRYWGFVQELGKYLRVVTLEDGETILNAFPDRNYRSPAKT